MLDIALLVYSGLGLALSEKTVS